MRSTECRMLSNSSAVSSVSGLVAEPAWSSASSSALRSRPSPSSRRQAAVAGGSGPPATAAAPVSSSSPVSSPVSALVSASVSGGGESSATAAAGRSAGAGAAASTRRPSRSVSTRSMRWASAMLWVAMSAASPPRRTRVRSSSNTASAVRESRSPVGSSASRISGRLASARAMATRCCSPPESLPGRCRSRSLKPTISKSTRARAAAWRRDRPAIICGSITFSRALNSASR